MLPNLFFLGFPKCGSTSWYHILISSSDVLGSVTDESPVFSRHDLTRNQLANLELTEYPIHSGERWVLNAHPLSILSNTTLAYIKEFSEKPKFIVCLRDPIRRTISHYNHLRSLLAENRTLESILEHEVREDPVWVEDQTQYYMRHVTYHQSRYDRYVSNALDQFPREDFLFLGFEEFFGENRLSEIEKVSQFLDLSDLKDQSIHANRTQPVTIQTLKNASFDLNLPESGETRTINADRLIAIYDRSSGKIVKFLSNPSDYSWDWFSKAALLEDPEPTRIREQFGTYFQPAYDYVEEHISAGITSNWDAPNAA